MSAETEGEDMNGTSLSGSTKSRTHTHTYVSIQCTLRSYYTDNTENGKIYIALTLCVRVYVYVTV